MLAMMHKAKVNVLAKPHTYIFFTLQLDSAWESSAKKYHKLLAVHACSLVLRLLPPPTWPRNKSLPCLLTFWHAIPTSFYNFNVFL